MEKIIINKNKLPSLKASLTNHINGINVNEASNTKLRKIIMSLVKNDEERTKNVCSTLKWIKHTNGEITNEDVVNTIITKCVMALNVGDRVKMKHYPIATLQTSWDD
jgi:hypothetical protein